MLQLTNIAAFLSLFSINKMQLPGVTVRVTPTLHKTGNDSTGWFQEQLYIGILEGSPEVQMFLYQLFFIKSKVHNSQHFRATEGHGI